MLWSLLKDLILEDISLEEVKTNYLLGKANAFERAGVINLAVRVYKQILRKDQKSVPVFLNLGGLYYRKGMYRRCHSLLRKGDPIESETLSRTLLAGNVLSQIRSTLCRH